MYPEPWQRSEMECFMKKSKRLKVVNCFCKALHLDVWQGSEYISQGYQVTWSLLVLIISPVFVFHFLSNFYIVKFLSPISDVGAKLSLLLTILLRSNIFHNLHSLILFFDVFFLKKISVPNFTNFDQHFNTNKESHCL